jgi:fructose-1,6-bisphosphatase/sedoheptulose 1,7-bisphosphatase-like protein
MAGSQLSRSGPIGPDSRGPESVVTGEGENDDAPMLASDEELGGGGPAYDIAVDPLECTPLRAAGLPGALTTIAMAARGAMHFPGPAFYMDEIVVGPAARGVSTSSTARSTTCDGLRRHSACRCRSPRCSRTW